MNDANSSVSKAVVDSAQQFLDKLFGKAAEETGGLITDQVRWWRWQNQVKILEKARKLLSEKDLVPKAIDLKLLVPLVESGSLESDEKLQSLWANLLASASVQNSSFSIQLFSVEALKKISSAEASMLNNLYLIGQNSNPEETIPEQTELLPGNSGEPKQIEMQIWMNSDIRNPDDLYADYRKHKKIRHEYHDVRESLGHRKRDFGMMCDNLMRLNLIYTTGNDVDSKRYIRFTQTGYEFVTLCYYPPLTK